MDNLLTTAYDNVSTALGDPVEGTVPLVLFFHSQVLLLFSAL